MMFIYSILTTFVSLLACPLFMLRARGRARLWERYGLWDLNDSEGEVIWFHAASLGEVNGIIPLIRLWRSRFPKQRILLTSTSVTGLRRAEGEAHILRLLPFDAPAWIFLAVSKLSISKFIFAETEIWPALLTYLKRREVPIFLVNGRISDYTLRRYSLLSFFFSRLLRKVDLLCVSDQESADRFLLLGADPAQIEICGNGKYDFEPKIRDAEEARRFAATFFSNDLPVLTLGSLRPGEEALWFKGIKQARAAGARFNLIVAPRHLEKAPYFEAELLKLSISYATRSAANVDADTILLDTVGELEAIYSFSQLSFIGGSLEDFGGHNPLEAAFYGSCIVLGPYVKNIRSIVRSLEANNGCIRISDITDITNLLDELMSKPYVLSEIGANAKRTEAKIRGASERILEKIVGATTLPSAVGSR